MPDRYDNVGNQVPDADDCFDRIRLSDLSALSAIVVSYRQIYSSRNFYLMRINSQSDSKQTTFFKPRNSGGYRS